MCMFLEEFFEQHQWEFRNFLEDFEEMDLVKDSGEYVFVDGEEGDYGRIKYFRNVNVEGTWTKLLAFTRVIEGGDMEHWEYTPYGKELLKERFTLAMNQWLNTF